MKRFDRIIFILALLLSLVGLPVIYTASWKWASVSLNNPSYFLKHQLTYLPLAIAGAFLVAFFPINFWKKNAVILLILSMILLVLVFIPPFGRRSRDVARWIEIGPIQIQPVEVVRFTWIIFLASFLSANREKKRIENIRFMWILLFLGCISLILYFQPNISMIILFSLATLVILFIANIDLKQFFLVLILLMSFITLSTLSSEYRKERFIFSSGFPFFTTYQQTQALKAIKEGGLLGKGWGRGALKFSIPEAYNDFLFPVILEEGGIIAGIFVLFIYVMLLLSVFYLFIFISKKDIFCGMLTIGILVFWSIEIMLNILMNIGFMPVMGLPLPFLSFGGSALVVNWAQVGLLMKIGTLGDKK
ncbi:MAG: FtsW/RodA/SpoVE family cell cycle protein [Dictyoglomaceae bacterium]|nr:FtsW/RodA/SpoVE family cell cycle protein [Dictyoglomaceae bacterium]HPU43715.1 FtsW/RodA/SpoVE family cell cycle protein [Dictyoglomaceae bacterium]